MQIYSFIFYVHMHLRKLLFCAFGLCYVEEIFNEQICVTKIINYFLQTIVYIVKLYIAFPRINYIIKIGFFHVHQAQFLMRKQIHLYFYLFLKIATIYALSLYN